MVAWSRGHNAAAESGDELRTRLADAGAGSLGWEDHAPVKLPGGAKAEAVSVPIGASLGWLVALGQHRRR